MLGRVYREYGADRLSLEQRGALWSLIALGAERCTLEALGLVLQGKALGWLLFFKERGLIDYEVSDLIVTIRWRETREEKRRRLNRAYTQKWRRHRRVQIRTDKSGEEQI